MTPQQIVEARAPEFEGYPRLASLIALAEQQTGQDWGNSRNMAVALLVLHWITMSTRAGAPGPVTSETEGQLSRSYGWSGEYGALASTAWGLELMGLRKQTFVGFGNRMFP